MNYQSKFIKKSLKAGSRFATSQPSCINQRHKNDSAKLLKISENRKLCNSKVFLLLVSSYLAVVNLRAIFTAIVVRE